MPTRNYSVLIFLLLTCPFLSSCQTQFKPQNLLRVTFLDVGQGDSIVIESPEGKVVVIDGGGTPGTDEREGGDPGNRIVVPFLRARGISAVDLLVPTHPDEDHAQGLIAVVDKLVVRSVLDCGQEVSTGHVGAYRRLFAKIKTKRLPVFPARRGEKIPLDTQTTLEILHPGKKMLSGTRSDDNNNAIVLRLVHKNTKILLTADIEEESESELLSSGQALDAQVIKIGHHGSRFSSQSAFLERVHPQFAVLSCGRKNRFGHPHPEVLARLAYQNIAVYRTDQQGAITITSDGAHLAFQKIY
jgi:competence protein ComEC